MSRYNPAEIEPRWQQRWEAEDTFRSDIDPNKPKFYTLGMFPYPSGAGLHVGHPESYTALDIVARYKRMTGFSVLNPMGFDAFGLATERAAVREGRQPAVIKEENVNNFRRQLKRLGFSYDWSREVDTSKPDYYRWTQWIFLKLWEKDLAYLAEVPVNWCPAQGTVLANEEVVDGKYVETGDPVERRLMKQWMLKITAYADRLIDDLEGLDWPAGVLEMQRQWIGRSEGAEVRFKLADHPGEFTVFTTRPDTLFGATYCVLAPEHPLVGAVTTKDRQAEVEAYVSVAKNRSDMERQVAADKEKTGVFSGSYAINPVNGERIPVWIADYVLMGYGTGAIMAVPAHDERDHAFARKFGIEIRPVYQPDRADWDPQQEAMPGDGVAINSGGFDGLRVGPFKKAIIDWLETAGLGTRKVNYKLRDWLFSRQRYWGEPFPVVHFEDGTYAPVDTGDLPVVLPELDDFRPTADGRPPLARAEDWVLTTAQGRRATRETNTMPQWAGSCWYYLRYMDPHNTELPFDPAAERYWGPVDLYIGGVEHAVLHLLYARFWHKVLYDVGLVHTKEPFTRLFNQGMILAFSYRESGGKYHHPDNVEQRQGRLARIVSAHNHEEVETDWYVKGTDTAVEQRFGKMGKSLNNVTDPLDVVAQYGADTLRLYEMFMGPLEQVKPWQTSGCEGIYRFLSRVWRLFVDEQTGETRPFGTTTPEQRRALHVALKETTEGIAELRLNTPISKMMEFVNACKGEPPARAEAEIFVLMLSTYAPHLGEELWERFGHATSLCYEPWPELDPSALVSDTVEVAVQVLGKLRGTVQLPPDADKETMLAAAKANPAVAKWLDGKTIVKEIVVPGRLVNFVVR